MPSKKGKGDRIEEEMAREKLKMHWHDTQNVLKIGELI